MIAAFNLQANIHELTLNKSKPGLDKTLISIFFTKQGSICHQHYN